MKINTMQESQQEAINDLDKSIPASEMTHFQDDEDYEMLLTSTDKEEIIQLNNIETAINIPQFYIKRSPASNVILDTVIEQDETSQDKTGQEDDSIQTINLYSTQTIKNSQQHLDSDREQQEIIDLDIDVSNIPVRYISPGSDGVRKDDDSTKSVHKYDSIQTIKNSQQHLDSDRDQQEIIDLDIDVSNIPVRYISPGSDGVRKDDDSTNSQQEWINKSIENLDIEAAPHRLPEQILYLKKSPFQYLAPEQVKYLAPEQVKYLSTWQIIGLTPENIPFVTPDQIKSMQPDQIKSMQPEQIEYLQPEQIEYLQPEQVQALTEDQIKALQWQHIKALKNTLTQEQKAILINNFCAKNFKSAKEFQDFLTKINADIQKTDLEYTIDNEALKDAFNSANISKYQQKTESKVIWNMRCFKLCDGRQEEDTGSITEDIKPLHHQSRSFQEYLRNDQHKQSLEKKF